MEFKRLTLETCAQATGTVIVIDVIRAFTTAAYAFAAGAETITLVGTVEEALALRERSPEALVMGEVGGLPPAGFDLGNSPSAILELDLSGRHLIQRTSAGTQGVVRSVGADTLLACSLCCAGATARYVQQLASNTVTFVVTGVGARNPANRGDEDAACADYVTARLRGERPDPNHYVRRVYDSAAGSYFLDPAHPEFPASDLELATAIDRFDFAMLVERRDGQRVMRTVRQ
jgi:2-phosphosulfolactate phosphatase